MDDLIQVFSGKIDELIGHKISSFEVIGEKKSDEFIPIIFWLRLNNELGYRFFMDAWVFQIEEYSVDEMEKLREEDFELTENDSIVNLAADYQLFNKTIQHAETDYLKSEKDLTARFLMTFEDYQSFYFLDYGDDKSQDFKIFR